MLFGEFAKCQAEAEYPELWQGLVGAWSPCLSPRGGTVLRDLSGRGNHGTLTNISGAQFVISHGLQGLDYALENSSIASIVLPEFAPGEFSAVLWCITRGQAGGGTADGIFTRDDLSSNRVFSIDIPATNLVTGRIWNSSGVLSSVSSTTTTLDGRPHLCSNTLGGGKHRFFVDLALAGSASLSGDVKTATNNICIGSFGSGVVGRYFDGIAFEAMLFRRDVSLDIPLLYRLCPGGWATPRRRRWNYATAQTAIPYWVFARKNARLIGGGVS